MRSLLLLSLALASAYAQDAAIFRTGVSLVHVDTDVVAQDGHVLRGLDRQDFRVFDNGKEQPILEFSSEEQSLDLILLFDVSGSMQTVVQQVAAAAHQGLAELRKGDRVAVWIFNSRTREIAPFTQDLSEVETSIGKVLRRNFNGGTLIHMAAANAARRFLDEAPTQRRRAVLMITDNVGTKTVSEDEVVKTFWDADAILSGLIVRSPTYDRMNHLLVTILAPQFDPKHGGMIKIADRTGGDALAANEVGTAFQEAMHRIRSRYSIYFAQPASAPGSTHKLRVELTHDAARRYPQARVRARTGYVALAR